MNIFSHPGRREQLKSLRKNCPEESIWIFSSQEFANSCNLSQIKSLKSWLDLWIRCIDKSSNVHRRMSNFDFSDCNNGIAEHGMRRWTEINCTAWKKCSFCADSRTYEVVSGFCIDYCSFKADHVNTGISCFCILVLLHCRRKAACFAFLIRLRKKVGRYIISEQGHLTRAHLPLFHFHPYMKSNWSVWKCISDFSPFRFVFQNSWCLMCSR